MKRKSLITFIVILTYLYVNNIFAQTTCYIPDYVPTGNSIAAITFPKGWHDMEKESIIQYDDKSIGFWSPDYSVDSGLRNFNHNNISTLEVAENYIEMIMLETFNSVVPNLFGKCKVNKFKSKYFNFLFAEKNGKDMFNDEVKVRIYIFSPDSINLYGMYFYGNLDTYDEDIQKIIDSIYPLQPSNE